MSDTKSNTVYSRVNSKPTTQWRKTESANFFFNDAVATDIYTLSLHDALPISVPRLLLDVQRLLVKLAGPLVLPLQSLEDRKSTRLNSSHQIISYAVFCLKKKNS